MVSHPCGWIPASMLTGIKLSDLAPSPLREKAGMRGVKHLILFSSPQPSPAGEGASFFNLMPVIHRLGIYADLCNAEETRKM